LLLSSPRQIEMRSIPAEHYSKNQAIAESLHQTSNDVIPSPRAETAL